MEFHNDDVLTAIQKEIDRHKRARLLCRLGFHDASEFWVDMYAHVDVRRCYRCGCALEAQDRLTATSDPSGLIGMYKHHAGRIAEEWFRAMTPPLGASAMPPHMNRGKATTGPG